MRKLNKRISRTVVNEMECQHSLRSAIFTIKAIANNVTYKKIRYDGKGEISFTSSIKLFLKNPQFFLKDNITYVGPGPGYIPVEREELLDMLRIIIAFYRQKKVRLLARAAYRNSPKPIGYVPLSVPQAA